MSIPVLKYWPLLITLGLAQNLSLSAQAPFEAVNPIIGTSAGGNTFPGAALPFGMIQWSPDTGDQGWYFHGDKSIRGFGLTHLSGAGCPLFADVPILPWSAVPAQSPGSAPDIYKQSFTHAHEQAHPGYYSVVLDNGTQVELTVADRSGMGRIAFPAGTAAGLLVNTAGGASSDVHVATLPPVGRELDASTTRIEGQDGIVGTVTSGGFCGSHTRYTLHVALQFQQPFRSVMLWHDAVLSKEERVAQGRHTGAWLDFGNTHVLLVKVGLSYVSEENAVSNLKAEITGWNFDDLMAHAKDRWQRMLGQVGIEGGTSEQRTIFYTGLYHMLLAPNLFSDTDGKYMGFDEKIHTVEPRQKAQYANYSDWDTYRNVVQLQSLLVPERESDMMQSLVNDAAQSGWLPRWPAANDVTYVMGGDSPDALLASAYAFGARAFDVKRGLEYIVKGATTPGEGLHGERERPYLTDYLKLGYVPNADEISASRTLEYATDDFAGAQLAKALQDTASTEILLRHAGSWKQLLDPETRWIRPRNADGSWLTGFDAERSLPHRNDAPVATDQRGFEEGNTYQYTFMIPHDYAGLFAAMGGEQVAITRLNKFFTKLVCWGEPCFNMANEPDFVTPYAYTFAGAGWKTQEVLKRILEQTFKTTPEGLAGNDDLGATSGVYVWNALGMYPAIPGVGGVVLSAPMFPAATITLGDGRTLHVTTHGTGPYVQSVSLDGHPYSSSWLALDKWNGKNTELKMEVGPEPNKQWAASREDRPPSMSPKP